MAICNLTFTCVQPALPRFQAEHMPLSLASSELAVCMIRLNQLALSFG